MQGRGWLTREQSKSVKTTTTATLASRAYVLGTTLILKKNPMTWLFLFFG
jgi:hypothetical protein